MSDPPFKVFAPIYLDLIFLPHAHDRRGEIKIEAGSKSSEVGRPDFPDYPGSEGGINYLGDKCPKHREPFIHSTPLASYSHKSAILTRCSVIRYPGHAPPPGSGLPRIIILFQSVPKSAEVSENVFKIRHSSWPI